MRCGGEFGGRIEVSIFLEQRINLREGLVFSHKGPLYRDGASLRKSAEGRARVARTKAALRAEGSALSRRDGSPS